MLKKYAPLVLILFVSLIASSIRISDAQAFIGQTDELVAPAGSVDPWTISGYMNEARQHHGAVLLNDGRVLVAGGQNSNYIPTSSSELYDPANGGWTLTGSLSEARFRHTLTVLSDGRVLAVGGVTLSDMPLGSAEIYDPVSGTWSTTGSLNAARYWHTATLLNDGKVLVVGGTGPNYTALTSAEVYDPASGSWTILNPLAEARYLHTATLLNDGTVLVTGGYNPGPVPPYTHASTELYDPNSDTWTIVGSLDHPRVWHTATLLENGLVLVSGGYDADLVYPAHGELYDPSSGSWSNTGTLSAPRESHTATLLSDGNVLIAGGSSDFTPNFTFSEADVYNTESGLFTPISPMPVDRTWYTATLLPDGSVLVAGGYNDSQRTLSGTVLYGSSGLKTVSNCAAFDGPGGLEDALVGGGDITFVCDGTIIVPEIAIQYDTRLDATGHEVTISGGNTNRIFHVEPQVSLELINLTVADGDVWSGDNIDSGGGIFNNQGSVTITDSIIDNHAAMDGGAIYNYGGVLTISRSTVSNSFAIVGGGIYNAGGELYVYDSTFSQNTGDYAGAIRNAGEYIDQESGESIYAQGTSIIRGTTFMNNRGLFGGAAIDNRSYLEAINSTFSHNEIVYPEDYGYNGGAILNGRGQLTITNSTIFGNVAAAGGGIADEDGYGWQTQKSITINNSILANNGGQDCYDPDGIMVGVNNLLDDACGEVQSLGPVTAFDINLTDNGGPTLTHAIIEGSNALDAADIDYCPSTDQRGIPRPQGPGCDIGAFEREYVPTPNEEIQNLIEDVQALAESGVLENANGLIAKLENAIASLERGNITAACGQLEAFINQVEGSLSNGKLPVEDGQSLIDRAREIRNNIGC